MIANYFRNGFYTAVSLFDVESTLRHSFFDIDSTLKLPFFDIDSILKLPFFYIDSTLKLPFLDVLLVEFLDSIFGVKLQSNMFLSTFRNRWSLQ